VTDATGDQGTFALAVKVGILTKAAPIRTTISPAASGTFSNQITATGGLGALSFTQTMGLPDLLVSPSGLLRTSGPLTVGAYSAGGTMVDSSGDHGTFSLNVVVAVPAKTVTLPVASRVLGHGIVGRTVIIRILGLGFFGQPTVTGPSGTWVTVIKVTGKMLTARITVSAHSRRGVFTLVVEMPNHKICRVRYVQR
jgi:hypothetical protein